MRTKPILSALVALTLISPLFFIQDRTSAQLWLSFVYVLFALAFFRYTREPSLKELLKQEKKDKMNSIFESCQNCGSPKRKTSLCVICGFFKKL